MQRVLINIVVRIRIPPNSFAIKSRGEVHKIREVFKLGKHISLPQIQSRHNPTVKTVVLEHVIHLGFEKYAHTAHRIYDQRSNQVVGAELGFVGERSSYPASLPGLHVTTQERFTWLIILHRLVLEPVIISPDFGLLLLGHIELIVVGIDDISLFAHTVRRVFCNVDTQGIGNNRKRFDGIHRLAFSEPRVEQVFDAHVLVLFLLSSFAYHPCLLQFLPSCGRRKDLPVIIKIPVDKNILLAIFRHHVCKCVAVEVSVVILDTRRKICHL